MIWYRNGEASGEFRGGIIGKMDNLWGGWDVRNKKHRHPNEDDFSFQQKFPKMCGSRQVPDLFPTCRDKQG